MVTVVVEVAVLIEVLIVVLLILVSISISSFVDLFISSFLHQFTLRIDIRFSLFRHLRLSQDGCRSFANCLGQIRIALKVCRRKARVGIAYRHVHLGWINEWMNGYGCMYLSVHSCTDGWLDG